MKISKKLIGISILIIVFFGFPIIFQMFLMTISGTWYGNVQIGKYNDSTYVFEPVYNDTTYTVDHYNGNSSSCVNISSTQLKAHPAFEKLLKAEACRTPLNDGITTCEISEEEREDLSNFTYRNAPGKCLKFEGYEGVYTFYFNRP
jgi:hypothetical protein